MEPRIAHLWYDSRNLTIEVVRDNRVIYRNQEKIEPEDVAREVFGLCSKYDRVIQHNFECKWQII